MSTSDQAVMKATGKVWDEWLSLLEQQNLSKLSHKEIAAKLVEDHDIGFWWAQTITIEYERMIGRREVGQSCEGDFQAGASKTLAGTMDAVFTAWQNFMKDKGSLNTMPYKEQPTTTKTDKWRYWRVLLANDSKANINIHQKAPAKVGFGVNHEKLNTAEEVAEWKAFWKECLKEFQATL